MNPPLPQTSASGGQNQTRVALDPVFAQAVAKFKKRLTKVQADTFVDCTIDDVRNQISDIQNHHGSQRRQRNMVRLSKFVEGMSQLGKVMEVFLNLDNTVALIWGPLKFLLLTASTWIDSLDSLLDVYERVGNVLPNLTRYPEIYKSYSHVLTHLQGYYCDILEFHSNALEVFSRSGWKILFHSAWKTFKTQFDPILKSLERHRTMLSEEKLTAVMEEIQAQSLANQQKLDGVVGETRRHGQCVQDRLDRLEAELQERARVDAARDLIAHQDQVQQQHRIIESKLDAPDCYVDHELASRKRFQSTSGNWILGHPLVSEWLDFNSKDRRKIYLSGIPGAGKTILTSSIISHCKQRQSGNGITAETFSLLYFYFKHQHLKKRSLVSLLLSLLSQLVHQDETIREYVYQTCCTAEPKHIQSLEEVSRHISIALKSQTRCFLIIDGLDECSEAPAVLEWLESNIFSQDSTSTGTALNVRLFISGQRDGVLEELMSEYPTIPLEKAPEHNGGIKEFAVTEASKIRDKFSVDSGIAEQIVTLVTSRAGGMFLYAQVVLENLTNQISTYNLKQEINAETFPVDLKQAYERAAIRVLRNPILPERDAAKEILGIIMCACRPLHWREIQSKFCIDPKRGEANIDRQLVLGCKRLCGSLVDVIYLEPERSAPGEEIVDFVHSTAKEYLEETKEICQSLENAKMALFCADYMVSRPLIPSIPKVEIQDHATKGYYAFQDYAVGFWWQHVQKTVANPPDSDTELFKTVLRCAHRALIEAGQLKDIQIFDDSPDGIRLLSSTMEKVPRNLRDWDASGIYEIRTARIREAIELLLNEPDKPLGSVLSLYGPWRYRCIKPWCQNFSNGFEHAKALKIHIGQHELPFICDIQGCPATIVGFATNTERENHLAKCHQQEDHPLFPDAKQYVAGIGDDKNALKEAIKRGDLDIVKAVMERDNKSFLLKFALTNVTESGHLHLMQYLAQSVLPESGYKFLLSYLLRLATKRRDLDMVAFLCNGDLFSQGGRRYISVSLQYSARMTPFPKSIVNRLLRKATSHDVYLGLRAAIREGNIIGVGIFADNIDSTDLPKALEYAAEIGNLPCLDTLLASSKVNPEALNLAGPRLFHIACSDGNLAIVKRLSTLAIDIHNVNRDGNKPLHSASIGGHNAVVTFLLEEGADIKAKNKHGKTPLQLAIESGHHGTEKLLLERDILDQDLSSHASSGTD
ncbi:uncharacterized protein FIESC28_07719 [Fusarium coffeatum]|uniref:Uncharacterized protein n=1 Tax=Fusarium coffeatum TaxID=231269 RepID=A0A366RBG0_9HYPO|nr:uncharacterized protein FIESC28_07719 [Fusarium coffeatum]RBR14483.1 hypothetical protein FIESC28_07719 [Fusarium coffeatum]